MDLSWQSSNIKFCRNIKNADPAPLWLPKLDWKKIYLWLDDILTCNSVITNTSLSNEIIISEMMTNQVSMRPKLNPNINLLINERKVQKNLNNLKLEKMKTFCSASIYSYSRQLNINDINVYNKIQVPARLSFHF